MKEIWDLYTKYREKTGQTLIRGERIPQGQYHLTVDVWIRSRTGEYLMARRSASRPTYPGQWECVSGSVLSGESSVDGAVREVKEELGLELSPADGTKIFSKIRDVIDGRSFQSIMDVWLFPYDGEVHPENATTDEVSDCRFMSVEEIKALYDAGSMVGLLDYFFCAFEKDEPDYRGIIGKTVSGQIDRPIGSPHPRHPDMIYPVNYGYVEGVMADDGAWQDVYVLGTKEPLTRFSGKVIRVYHRFNDVEDKWIVSPDGNDIPDDQILGDIAFQEQYFYGKLYGAPSPQK